MEIACIATCSRGLEEVLVQELASLGLRGRARPGAVAFLAGWPQVVRANLWLRTAVRVLIEMTRGACESREDLYQLVSGVQWEELFGPGATLAVQVAGRNPAFANTHFAALVVKDAIVDRIRQLRGYRPSVDLDDPHLRVVLHLEEAGCGVYLDTSGAPLAHRGYRQREAEAPLSECLAAGLLLLAGYDGTQPLYDLMCGSGTIVIEAALLATATAPGTRRHFAFERWPFVDPAHLREEKERALAQRRQPEATILGRDVSQKALVWARRATRAAGVEHVVRLERGDIRDAPLLPEGSLVVSNPPYGLRLGDERKLAALYRQIGDVAKERAVGSTLWLLMGNSRLARQVGLAPTRKIELFNGPVRCQFCCYPVIAGQFRGRSS